MLTWINNVVGSISGWFGSGVSSVFKWLFTGIETILTKVINAADSLWGLLDAIWDFAVGLIQSLMHLFAVFFPFIPAEVTTVISMALLAAAIVGIYKRVRGQ